VTLIHEHLIALLVVLPMIGAPLCLLLPSQRLPWYLATTVCAGVFFLSAVALQQIATGEQLHYSLGGWAPPWGIELRLDVLNALLALLITSIAFMVVIFSGPSVRLELRGSRIAGFYTAYLLTLTGLLGITVTGDVFNLFVFLEISALSSYVLISLGNQSRALVAAYQYLILGTIGATFFLIGIGLTYAMTGTLNMADLATRLEDVHSTRTVHTAFAFIIVGLAIKFALYPLHQWLPDAYAYAPSAVSALLAAVATKVAIYALLRFVFVIFGASFVFDGTPFGFVLLGFALAAILVGSWVAIFQSNVKRMLAYSSVTQIGYIVLGISMLSVMGLTASILHLVNHAIIKGTLFMALGCVFYRLGSVNLTSMHGLGREMPWTMTAFVIGGLSLIGLPLTAGFLSKWYLLMAALDRGWWPVVLFVITATLMATIYIGKVVEAAWFKPAQEGRSKVREAPLLLLLPTWILALANIYFGIDSRLTLGMASVAAEQLLGGSVPESMNLIGSLP
jgi:multicomponent Na+:H+ antiporter subunit D